MISRDVLKEPMLPLISIDDAYRFFHGFESIILLLANCELAKSNNKSNWPMCIRCDVYRLGIERLLLSIDDLQYDDSSDLYYLMLPYKRWWCAISRRRPNSVYWSPGCVNSASPFATVPSSWKSTGKWHEPCLYQTSHRHDIIIHRLKRTKNSTCAQRCALLNTSNQPTIAPQPVLSVQYIESVLQ